MKLSELIKEAAIALQHHGDIECLIEVMSEDCVCLYPVGELSFEDREGFGPSIALLQ